MHKRMINWDEGRVLAIIFQEMNERYTQKQIEDMDEYEIAHIVIDNYNRELLVEIARSCAGSVIDYFKEHPISIEEDLSDTRRKIGNQIAKAHDMIAILKDEKKHSEEGGGPF